MCFRGQTFALFTAFRVWRRFQDFTWSAPANIMVFAARFWRIKPFFSTSNYAGWDFLMRVGKFQQKLKNFIYIFRICSHLQSLTWNGMSELDLIAFVLLYLPTSSSTSFTSVFRDNDHFIPLRLKEWRVWRFWKGTANSAKSHRLCEIRPLTPQRCGTHARASAGSLLQINSQIFQQTETKMCNHLPPCISCPEPRVMWWTS